MGANWAKDYQPVVYEWFRQGAASIPSMIPTLFAMPPSRRLTESSLGVGGIGIEVWNEYRKTGKTGHADLSRGYPKTFTHENYTARFSLKKEYIENDELGIVQEMLFQMGLSAAQKKETDAASIFNNSFTAGLGPDGVVLCSASHPVSPDDTSTLRDNVGADAFSYSALKSARQAMRAWKDAEDKPLQANGTLALLPIELADVAIEIINATNKPGGADNDANAVQGFQHRTWDYLTDAESWWLIDPIRAKQFLKWYDRVPLMNMIVEETTTDVVYEFRMMYSFGWTHWSFVFGNLA